MRHLIILLSAAATIIMSGCGGRGKSDMTDFSRDIYRPAEAVGFSIAAIPGDSSSLLTVTNPWQGADSISTGLFIARNGEKAPDGFEGQILDGEAKRIVAMSSTFVAMLDEIGALDRVVGVSGLGFISNPTINSKRDEIDDVGYDGNIDYETLISLDPDLILLYGVNGASMMEPKLKELGIPYMYIGDYLEQSPTGKAEWMVALGEITGRRIQAVKRFRQIKERYDSLAAANASWERKPKVMINAPYGDSWFMPSSSSYMTRLISDAGGEYVFSSGKNSNSSVTIGDEQAYLLASEADIWLNPGQASSIDELIDAVPRFADVRAVTARQVYNNTARMTPSGGNDFYESGTVRPDAVLSDLIKIFHCNDSVASLNYYIRLE